MTDWCHQNQRGLEIVRKPTFQEYEFVGGQLSLIQESLPFLIGDWINLGIEEFGETWSQAASKFKDKKAGTLGNYASICRKIPYDVRRQDLTFSHHQHVRTLTYDQMREELAYAADQEINSEDFRSYIDKKYKKATKDKFLDGLNKTDKLFDNNIKIAPDDFRDPLIAMQAKLREIIKNYEFMKGNENG